MGQNFYGDLYNEKKHGEIEMRLPSKAGTNKLDNPT